MNILIAAQRPPEISETFIDSHLTQLPGPPALVTGGYIWPFRSRGWFPVRMGLEQKRIVGRTHELLLRTSQSLGLHSATLCRAPAERDLATYLARTRTDVVLAEYGLTGAEIANTCERAGVPLVVHFHGFDAYQLDVLHSYDWKYQQLFERASLIICGSGDMVDQVISLGAPPAITRCIHVGADVPRFALASETPRCKPIFVMVGRLVEKKAPLLSIRAFELVQRVIPDARLRVVGEGPLAEPCRQYVREASLDASVRFYGAVDNASIPELLSDSLVFIQHSMRAQNGDSEGTIVSILEAGAAGLPAVVSEHGGARETVLDGKTGFLFTPGDVASMANSMIRLARDPKRAMEMGRAARDRVERNFSMSSSIVKLSQALAEAVDQDQMDLPTTIPGRPVG